ncbi:ribonuclease P protein component [Kribbella sp. CA-293567]|uniref:ribonuclease P protein component n=1 Tax=Kribbella sp. CA-293567 TaxID=3002436 RepID=UPI0022DD3BBC|nr:ribonuclease P protein component [Kribbella sp. CA-293567]WBQ05502.1 ribonuclease P protein component [Kribbella sp. CA-293567]
MLPASNRLRRSDEFRRAVRTGRRAGRRAVVVHLLPGSGPTAEPARVGFVVNKAVGNAVLRNRVHRRLRALMAAQLSGLPAGSLTVVRALPPSAASSYDELADDLAGALRRVLTGPSKPVPANDGR